MRGRLAGVWFEFQDTCFRPNLQISGHALFHMAAQFFRKSDRPYVVLVIKRATRNFMAVQVVDCVWNATAHAQKPDFVFRQNKRVHLNRRGRQFSRLLAAEACASAVVMLDTPSSEVVWWGTGYPLYSPVSPSLPLPCVTVCHHISTGLYNDIPYTVLTPVTVRSQGIRREVSFCSELKRFRKHTHCVSILLLTLPSHSVNKQCFSYCINGDVSRTILQFCWIISKTSQRPYHAEYTGSRLITAVKQCWTWLVLGWVTPPKMSLLWRSGGACEFTWSWELCWR